jgi:hypothetical protein
VVMVGEEEEGEGEEKKNKFLLSSNNSIKSFNILSFVLVVLENE